MKLKDIKKFISDEYGYEINIGFSYIEKALEDYVENYKLDLNPDFQRGHVWTKEQQTAYMEFLLKGGKTSRVIYFNCPYYFDYTPEKYDMDMVCVDGLQRLTAIRKFLNNELKVFGYYLNEFEDAEIIRRTYDIKFNINSLSTRKEVLQWYLDINTGGTIHSKEEIEKVQQLLAECQ